MQQRTYKLAVMIAHDLVATALAVILTFVVRFDGALLAKRLHALPLLLPPFVLFAGFAATGSFIIGPVEACTPGPKRNPARPIVEAWRKVRRFKAGRKSGVLITARTTTQELTSFSVTWPWLMYGFMAAP